MILTIVLHWQLSAVTAQLEPLRTQGGHPVLGSYWIALGTEGQGSATRVTLGGSDVP